MSKASVFIVFCMCMALPASASRANKDVLSGRWNVVFGMPQGSYETPVEFTVGHNGNVTASVLGPLGTFSIASTAGHLDGNKLTLNAETSYGKLIVNATLEGDQLKGEWAPEGLGSLFFSGTLSGQRDRAHVSKPYREVFDSVLAHIERSFYTPDLNGVKVSELHEHYRERAGASRTDGEFLSIMRRMLGEFRTSHLEFFAISSMARKVDEAGGPTEAISWRQLTPSIGYLRIDSFENGAKAVARVDSAFAALGHNAAIVIDLRDNAGGSLSAAMRLGDYILPKLQPVGYFVSRDGLTRHRVRSIDQLKPSVLPVFSGYDSDEFAREMASKGGLMLVAGGRAERAYRGRVVVLIDEYSFSASEALASVVKETRVAALIGRRTSGSMLSATTLSAGGGWTLLLPVWDFRTARGARVEGKGVEPDIEVKHENDDISTALKFLNESGLKP